MQITIPANNIQTTTNRSTLNRIKDEELVRVILQSLIDLGYK